ncbi:hypothetical protein Dsin_003129 [Dipteronia sinensis]|uniref:RST domain-containing protein n=1 Tax=Dipteronia sinensis TaxID=43782 RepID=A0AAE0EJY2_9ROSI|nr:hypothetical protein Dsin_003129 [Dipteronia sinensis]
MAAQDESMHSGADVEAFQAALNRDIGGDVSTSQPSDLDSELTIKERIHNQDGKSQYSKIQKMSNQLAVSTEHASSAINRRKQVSFALLVLVVTPHLDKVRSRQLHTLYAKFKVGC